MAPGTRVCGGSRARDRSVTIGLAVAVGLSGWLGASRPAAAQAAEARPAPPDSGAIAGRVVDLETDAPLAGVRVIVTWPTPSDGGEPREEVETTDANGDYRFAAIPAGHYAIEFVRKGYSDATLHDFAVNAGEAERADMRLAPGGQESAGPPPGVEEVLVLGARVEAIEASREESNEMINTLSAAEIGKFSAADIADVILRIPGVSVQEGQFAVIRGLEDRYSSTLYNSAVVPSPDPDRQSIPLDLFPTEMVDDLVVAKTFGPDLPSNSSAGSINILTNGYTDEPIVASVKVKGGFNTRAIDEFLRFDHGSPVGVETDGWDTAAREFGGSFAGRSDLLDHEFRYRAVVNWGNDYQTADGSQEARAPSFRGLDGHFPVGDLALGQQNLTNGHFDLTTSEYSQQQLLYGGFGFDLDEEGDHRIDLSLLWTHKDADVVEYRQNGYLAGFDYSRLAAQTQGGEELGPNDFWGDSGSLLQGKNAMFTSWIADAGGAIRQQTFGQDASQGAPWFASFSESRSFEVHRDLHVYQLNGHHDIAPIEGLSFSWTTNYASTSQDDDALGARFFYEPCGISVQPLLACPPGVTPIGPDTLPSRFPTTPTALGPGTYIANKGLVSSTNSIDENQYFARADGDYEHELFDWLSAEVKTGLWYEQAKRNVDSAFLDPNGLAVGQKCNGSSLCFGSNTQFAILGDSPVELGRTIFGSNLLRGANGDLAAEQPTRSEDKRKIQAWNGGARATLWDWLDLLGGIRLEKIDIESKNDPFQTGFALDGSPKIFPSKYLMFDRLDNSARREPARLPPFNDQILGLDVPLHSCNDPAGTHMCVDLVDRAQIESLIDGKIDETRVLPAAGITFRPYEGLTLRGAYSRTVARPSFREMGYYVTVAPGTDDLSIGNPQLELSDVESWDLRGEYFWGDFGDMLAVSLFYKTIEKPIEQIIVRDPAVFDTRSLALYRTWFNNQSDASVQGIELEARKSFSFLRFQLADVDTRSLEFLDYLSIGGNYSYIDASVDRSEFEIQRAQRFFGNLTNAGHVPHSSLENSRRLTNQPKWIANADLTFDHPDWGTRLTLAFFAISDVLDAVGGATLFDINASLGVREYTLDRYSDSFYELGVTASQQIWQGIALKFTANNLTDTSRGIYYDPQQTSQHIAERKYRVGRDFSLELSWTFSGPDL